MERENASLLPYAHQRIRLGDIQASAHKWTKAIEYYVHAIECFKAIEETLQDSNLIILIQAQIVQCEKTIHLCHLKDQSEQAIKAEQVERLSKMNRAHSTSNLASEKSNRTIPRCSTMTYDPNNMDSFAASMFPKTNMNSNEINSRQTQIHAKKNKKDDSHKIEELQVSNEALRNHLKMAIDRLERLTDENNHLRSQKEINTPRVQSQSKIFTISDEENSELTQETTS